MLSLSSQDYMNIIISAIGIIFFAYKRFIEPQLPQHKATKINNDLAILTQSATIIVQKVQQVSSGISPAQRKQIATEDIKLLMQELGASIPSDEVISGAIESAVWILKQTGVASLSDRETRQVPGVKPPDRNPYN